MQSTKFTIPGAAARLNYRLPVDFARAVLSRARGKGAGSLCVDFQEYKDPYCAHVLYDHRQVAAFVFTRRFPDGMTEGSLVSAVPEIFEILRQALLKFVEETEPVPA